MLIEFSGPSASGKSTFVNHLLQIWPQARNVRSFSGTKLQRRLFQAWLGVKHSGTFSRSLLHAYRWHRRGLGLPPPNYFRSAIRMAVQCCRFKEASESAGLWLLDQGRLQLGSWLPQFIIQDVASYGPYLSDFVRFGDGVVIISLAPEASVRRLRRRGDHERGEQVARDRGYSSFLEYCTVEHDRLDQKVALIVGCGNSVLIIDIDNHETIRGQEVVGGVSSVRSILADVGDEFQEWWSSEALATP